MTAGLRARAERAGIEASYRAAGSGELREISERTRERLLAALEAAGAPPPADASARSGTHHRAPRCVDPRDRLGGEPGFGIWANLYSLRSDAGLGVGNLSDLSALAELAAAAGAAFVGTNPLHATWNDPPDVSPYQPISRLFQNPLYLDPVRVPEWQASAEARRLLASDAGAAELAHLRKTSQVDYRRSAALHDRLLRLLHARFREECRDRPGARASAYRRFCDQRGAALRDFATFCALALQRRDAGWSRDWREWPPGLRSPSSPRVREFREAHPEEIDYHCFLQFELDRQLGMVAERARRAGLTLGLYPDLAVGSAAGGFDTWAFPDAFALHVSLGAPPDDYAAEGQDWGLPPLHPFRLPANDFDLFRRLLRAAFCHAGMLRVDHILGFVRQYWIPAGEPSSAGAYVRFPARALLTVLAEESQRAGAAVVGEDLGTVPSGLASRLARHGVLSTRVLLFERDARGRFRPAHRYSRRALCTATTHDSPTLAAFLAGSDLELRARLGLLEGEDLARGRAERQQTVRSLCRRLSADGALRPGAPGAGRSYPELCAAVYRFLCATPAPLVGLALDDLAQEVEPVNLPGVAPDVYPSWCRRMGRSVSALARDPEVTRMLEAARDRAVARP